ncbi:Transposon Tn3 resolvase [Caulifigura coniformis]|uniref:Transposon Tn3 resolvase n=1 Tax=Caulifigura coniformis TaxID=2527983 RepID=A0A517S7Y6_9PLAN|nr:recombinase family protein [Caulifigura coniformis]QDT52245.1 Transposon Tn3 resolvase [Caulifigura coniformis]QDT54476.1 Transposon Tn3 resolvase [Caulifigura coniformis]
MSKIAVYVRVSTFDQEKGIESQKTVLREYLEAHGMGEARWYTDRMSGATTKRPEFEKLQKEVFSGRVKCIVCWKLDRISRSLKDGINVLTDWIEKDVRVVAVAQQLDFSGTVGQLIATVFFALAQMERENLRENTKRGMYDARLRGARIGKRPSLFAKDIVPLLEKGMSLSGAAKHLKKSRQAVYDCLKREQIDLSIYTSHQK